MFEINHISESCDFQQDILAIALTWKQFQKGLTQFKSSVEKTF